MSEDEIALPPGRWVRRGLVLAYEADPFVLPDDYHEAVKMLHGLGQNDRQISDELGGSAVKVWRARQWLGLAAIQRTGEPIRKSQATPIDWSVVQRLIDGDRAVESKPAERREAIRELNTQGLIDREIGVRIGMLPRSVFRVRERHGITRTNRREEAA